MKMIQVPLTVWNELTARMGSITELMQSIMPAPPADNADKEQLPSIKPDVWYDNADLCQMLNVSKFTAQKWRTEKKIKYTILCGKANYLGRDILKFLQLYGKQHRITYKHIEKTIPKGRL